MFGVKSMFPFAIFFFPPLLHLQVVILAIINNFLQFVKWSEAKKRSQRPHWCMENQNSKGCEGQAINLNILPDSSLAVRAGNRLVEVWTEFYGCNNKNITCAWGPFCLEVSS